MSQNKFLILYKLLGDTLFLLLLFFGLSLVVDNLIPGMVSSHVSFLRIIFLIALNLAALYIIGAKADIKITQNQSNKKTIAILAIVGCLVIFNGLFKLSPYFSLSFLFLSAISGFFLWRMFFNE